MPDARNEVLRLGVELRGGREFSGILFAHQGREGLAVAEFASGTGTGIRRLDLHRCLIERADAVGVRFRWGAYASLDDHGKVAVGGEDVKYRYLVGADGVASRVRRWAGLEQGSLKSQRFGFRRHYRVRPWSSYVEIHWGPSGQLYVTPISDDDLCVVAITRQRGRRFDSILEEIPFLHDQLSGRRVVGRDRAGLTTTRKLNRVVRGNVALVGDASGSADAITGEGLAMAFRKALLLGEALERDAIADYDAGHDAIVNRPQAMAAMLLAMDRWDWLRDGVIQVLADDPAAFGRLLALHIGDELPSAFIAGPGLRLGLKFLLSRIHPSSRQTASQRSYRSVEGEVTEPSILRSARDLG
jgi:flavin-dependent dehydrogenase